MKTNRCNQIKMVHADTSEEFEQKFNEAAAELGSNVELRWAPNKDYEVCLIYTQVTKVAETAKEEYEEILGKKYHCMDCPYFRKGKGVNGSKGCSKNVPLSVDFSPACEMFYDKLARGMIKPVEED